MTALRLSQILSGMFGTMAMPTQDRVASDLRRLLLTNRQWATDHMFSDVTEDELRCDRILITVGLYSASHRHRVDWIRSMRRRHGALCPRLVRVCADILLDGVQSPGAVLRKRMQHCPPPITRSRANWSTDDMLHALSEDFG